MNNSRYARLKLLGGTITIKLIALDIDDTLLNSEKKITAKTYEALIAAQKQGVKIALVSGRPHQGLKALAEKLQLKTYGGYLVSYNGSLVYDLAQDKRLFNQALDPELAQAIFNHLEKFDVYPFLDVGSYSYVYDAYADIGVEFPPGFPNVVAYETRNCNFKICEVDHLADKVQPEGVNKVLVAGNPDYMQENVEAMVAPFKDQVTTAFSAPFYLEYTDQGIDKGHALKEAFEPLGITSENIIAFGDNENDLAMIKYAGVGVAMGNAVAAVKDVADFITDDCDHDGIAKALEKYL